MFDLLKFFARTVIYQLRRGRARTTERKIAQPDRKKELYPSSIADTSRLSLQHGEPEYLGVRVPLRTPRRFSLLFPGVLTKFECEYFDSQSWAQTFEDDRRPGEPSKGTGYFLRWTDDAMGTPSLFGTAWTAAKDLPKELSEIHADGEFLRAVFHGDRIFLGVIDTSKIRARLRELSAAIPQAAGAPKKRTLVTDRFPVLAWIINGAVYFAILIAAAIAFVVIQPPANYVNSYAEGFIGKLYVGSIALLYLVLKLKKTSSPLRQAAFSSLLITFVGSALYFRGMYSMRGEGESEQWVVTVVKEKKNKYTQKLEDYRVSLTNPAAKERVSVNVSVSITAGCQLKSGNAVEMSMHRDPFGNRYADSARLACPTAGAAPKEIQLIKGVVG